MRHPLAVIALSLASLAVVAVPGCQTARTAYYNAWEGIGYAKRERLVDNVRAASKEQDEAKKEFANALEEFRSVVQFSGGDLEKTYNRLNDVYERCEGQADEVRAKVDAVKNVANALFSEWQDEIKQIEDDPSLERESKRMLNQTKSSYNDLTKRMDAAVKTMETVQSRFKNRVFFVKHNLNAQAIASLKGTELELGSQIERLIREMEASIAEADEFIAELAPAKS